MASKKAASACCEQVTEKQRETGICSGYETAGKVCNGGQHMSSVPTHLPKGNPTPLTQKVVGIILDYTALSGLIKGAFFHTD